MESEAGHAAIDAAFQDACIFRRCMHRIHRFSPGTEGRVLLPDGDLCVSLGHWSLITSGRVDPSTLSPSSLHAACRDGRLDALESLVSDYGADANARDDGGWTVLHSAMACGDTMICERLIALGAENVPTEDGVYASALRPEVWDHVSRESGQWSSAVLSSFLRFWFPSRDSWQPPDTIEIAVDNLVQQIAGDTFRSEQPVPSALVCRRVCAAAAVFGSAVVNRLGTPMRRPSIARLMMRWTVFTAAAAHGRYSVARLCAALGADLRAATSVVEHKGAQAAVWLACREGKASIVRLLLDHGTPIDQRLCWPFPALEAAMERNHLECARLLLDRGARFQ